MPEPLPGRARRLAAGLLRLLGMALLLGIFLRGVDWPATAGVLASARLWPTLAVAMLAYAGGQVFNGLGWRQLVAGGGIHVSLGEMIRHDLGSVFWSVVLPGSIAGEVVKGARVSGGLDQAQTTAAAIISARLAGGGAAAVLALGLLPAALLPDPARTLAALCLVLVVVAAVVGLGLVRAGPAVMRRHLPTLAARLPPGTAPSWGGLGLAFLSSLAAHSCFTVVFACFFRAVGAPVGLADAAVIYVLTTVAQALPITLGGLGVRELTMSSLGALLVSAPAAAAASVVGTATFALPVLLGGLLEARRALRRRRADA